MSFELVRQIRNAVANLNPDEVQAEADKPVRIGLYATDAGAYRAIENFLVPQTLSPARRIQVLERIYRAEDAGQAEFDLEIYGAGLYPGPKGFTYYPSAPERSLEEILRSRPELSLPLARAFPAFRQAVVHDRIHRIAKENATFALITSLPNIVPSFILLPWSVGEFASDTAILTTNQVRLAFLLAAASDRPIGFRHQRAEIASIVAGAFGWRSLARELVGKIPLGGGVIPKAAIAYAGTYVAGMSLERIYRIGYGLTRQERREAYAEAYERGKSLVEQLVAMFRHDRKPHGPQETIQAQPASQYSD